MAPCTPRNTRRRSISSGVSTSLSQVIAGSIEQRAIASQLVSVSSSDECLDQMSIDLKNIMMQLASMDCKVGQLMDSQRRNIGAAARQESMPASLLALAPSSPLPVPAMSEQEIGSTLINGKVWKRNLKSRDSTVIAENEARRRWNVNEHIDHPKNAALVDYLHHYVLAQPCAGNFWSRMVILAHCTHTYLTNWRLIDNEMGLEVGLLSEMLFLHLLQKDVMLDGESDMEDMNVATLNNFLEIVDFVAVQTCSDKSMLKSRAKMPRLQSGKRMLLSLVT
ncbi:hypothetical protein PHYBLDRAFT_73741 [Phycomyces blakesleeanus NRRL 1555(-)]|uniref:Uncharacterized protein n=1 Tax=Phycomyces blakesleeanus (strain ATCC 8743b / DSM 1359 / FGSC 10004 / NBRC 33097 / NRRL 1555) TaxID=763407 RepID=A0A162TH98_PHYB8|nr:hypothetical protein PHYBLDRAFT_73741 [Phycomyces blakesleeanus NRRL 1555(-)]OAD68572.1 hypothetical protein PHYBLDRAFT_73741 [Phycomyces blakesleeanus NRRL 1555(-)]|eukprot:XP_018286612.1 hypothetical protein PHYBLDRAFT_73741 [Phycomyces blakesleeanus NRRL 1555(-)]